MSARPVVVVGAGGHGQAVADALQVSGRTVLGFVDPAFEAGAEVVGLRVFGGDGWLSPQNGYELANGMGGVGRHDDLGRRRSMQVRLEAVGFRFVEVRHPTAVVSPRAELGGAVQLLARAVVQTGAWIGDGAVINAGAIVEHGCHVGDFSHCATGSILCGDVTIGRGAHVGAGAVIRQGVSLEDGVVVGAGAVVLGPGEGPGMLLGVPARRWERG